MAHKNKLILGAHCLYEEDELRLFNKNLLVQGNESRVLIRQLHLRELPASGVCVVDVVNR